MEPCDRATYGERLKVTAGCDRHQLRLLSECPKCKARFKIPALWVDGWRRAMFYEFCGDDGVPETWLISIFGEDTVMYAC